MNKRVIAVLALLLWSAMPVSAQDYARGYVAYSRGDYATALREFRPLAESGRGSAQFFLGELYFRGNGVERDYPRALKWLRAAAEQGVAYAQLSLGRMYHHGWGVDQDIVEACKWYSLAARRGPKRAKEYFRGIKTVMTKGQIRKARWRAHQWRRRAKKY